MAVLTIRTLPDPVLRRKAKRVKAIDTAVQKLICDMLETLHAAPGRAGLAAPQVGVSLRVAVIDGGEGKPDVILVNPEVLSKKGERLVTEGCLSLPGFWGEVKRAETVTVKCVDDHGKPCRIKGKELLAQALEHEIDHLNGIIFIDHLESPDKLEKVEPEEETEGE